VPSNDPARPHVCLALTNGWIDLVQLEKDGKLTPVRRWNLNGQVNRIFLRSLADGSQRIGCVVDQSRLVWIDPEEGEPLWEYRRPDAVLVGQPQLIDGVLLVADQAGRFVTLDPQTGKVGERAVHLQGSMAAVASPVAFGPGLAFAPLSDGTVLLLPLKPSPKP